MNFRIVPIDPETANRLRATATVVRVADEHPGFPCRQCLRDAAVGDELVLVSHDPFEDGTASPYRTSSPIFLHRDDCSDRLDPAPLPAQLTTRRLSVRAFDADAMMLDGRVVEGRDLAEALHAIARLDGVAFAHVHNAAPGCFAAKVELAAV